MVRRGGLTEVLASLYNRPGAFSKRGVQTVFKSRGFLRRFGSGSAFWLRDSSENGELGKRNSIFTKRFRSIRALGPAPRRPWL